MVCVCVCVSCCVPAPAAAWAGAAGTRAVCCGPPVSAFGPPVVLCAAAAAWPRRWARRHGRSAATPGASLGATAAGTGPSCRGLFSAGRTQTAASCGDRGSRKFSECREHWRRWSIRESGKWNFCLTGGLGRGRCSAQYETGEQITHQRFNKAPGWNKQKQTSRMSTTGIKYLQVTVYWFILGFCRMV